jgi:TPR repeat protein
MRQATLPTILAAAMMLSLVGCGADRAFIPFTDNSATPKPTAPAEPTIAVALDAYDRGDYEGAFRQFSSFARAGDPDAQYRLGILYETGLGVTQSDADAVKWYRKAAAQGNAAAHNRLGVMYERGQGVAQNYAEAVKWYRRAADTISRP